MRLDDRVKVLLLGGTSHVGKSTVAAQLADKLGWGVMSTDRMARYPGRPWTTRPDYKREVAEHFLSHDADGLVAGQLAHYQSMWPIVERLVREHAAPSAERLVLEGSGVWPDNVAALALPSLSAVWLTASPELIEARILSESRFDEADEQDRRLIRQFVVRSQGYDVKMMEAVHRLGLPFVTVTAETDVESLAEECLARVGALRKR
jgi:2-phosphoglycerate kinase